MSSENQEQQAPSTAIVCRQSVYRCWTAVAVATCLAIAGGTVAISETSAHHLGLRVMGVGTAVFGLAWAVAQTMLARRALAKGNWALQVHESSISIRLGGYNWNDADAAQNTLVLAQSDIASFTPVRSVRVTNTVNAQNVGDRNRYEPQLYLDVHVQPTQAVTIKHWINQRNQQLQTRTKRKTVALYAPIRWDEPASVRIEWRSTTTQLTPALKAILPALAKVAPVMPELTINEDFSVDTLRKLAVDEQKHRIKELSLIDPMAAQEAVSRLWNYTTTQAVAIVGELRS